MDAYQQLFKRQLQHIFPLPDKICGDVVSHFKLLDVPKNSLWLKEGQVSDMYCFLAEGFMRSYTNNTEGEEVTMQFFCPNQLVVDVASFFKRMPSQENIQALTDAKVLYATFDQIQFLFHSMQEFRELGRMILVNFNVQLKQRMLSMVQQTAEQRYEHLIATNPAIFQNAPLKYIASYLGVTDTSLSRIRREYAKN